MYRYTCGSNRREMLEKNANQLSKSAWGHQNFSTQWLELDFWGQNGRGVAVLFPIMHGERLFIAFTVQIYICKP